MQKMKALDRDKKYRQVSESEAFYRIFPNLHLTDSNIGTSFVHTGFEKSRFLIKLSEEEAGALPENRIIQLDDREGVYYIEASSLRDKYTKRPCELEHICFAQFAKRYIACPKPVSEQDQIQEDGLGNDDTGIKDDFIISPRQEMRRKLPKGISLNGEQVPYESGFMRKRKPIVLRYKKYKMTSDSHQFHYSQMELFQPWRDEAGLFKDNESKCEEKFIGIQSAIEFTKSKVMEFLDQVVEAKEAAEDFVKESVADELDAMNEQENDDCEEEGVHDQDEFIAQDPKDVKQLGSCGCSEGRYKSIELDDLELISEETMLLDQSQKLVIDIGITFAKDLVKAAKNGHKIPEAPLCIVQGGAGSGKSHVINLLAQWLERILRTPGDSPNQPYILKCAFTGCAAANIDGQTLTSTFNIGFGNEFRSLSDKVRDEKRTSLINLQILIIDEYSMVKSDMLYQLDLRLKEIKERQDVAFGGVSVILFGDILQLKPVKGVYLFKEPKNEIFQLSHAIEPLWSLSNVCFKFKLALVINSNSLTRAIGVVRTCKVLIK